MAKHKFASVSLTVRDGAISSRFGMVNQPVGNRGLGIFFVVGFNLGPLLQGQTRIAKLKSAYNSFIIGSRGLGW